MPVVCLHKLRSVGLRDVVRLQLTGLSCSSAEGAEWVRAAACSSEAAEVSGLECERCWKVVLVFGKAVADATMLAQRAVTNMLS